MLKSLAVAALAVAALGTAACSSSSSSPVSPSMSTGGGSSASMQTIKSIAVSNPNFTTLVQALVKANLADAFDGSASYTVFAPTNAAFDAAAKAFNLADGPALVAALDVPTLTAVLTYHVTTGSRDASSVLAAGQLTMLDNNTARVSTQSGAAKIENATITATDIRASNGYIHVIDAVILPPSLR
jgi:uncharacterized surface protein with fasciclin (FAS1) repeats